MKKTTMALALCLVSATLFTACSKYNEDGAVKFLETRLKCPSSLKVQSIEAKEYEAHSTYDTIYYISEIYGLPTEYVEDMYDRIDSVKIDSMLITAIDYPVYVNYTIKYDADNLMGASVRNTADIYEIDGKFYSFEDYIIKFMNENKREVERKPTSFVTSEGDFILAQKGEWCNIKKLY